MVKYKYAMVIGAMVISSPVLAEDNITGPYVALGGGWTQYSLDIKDKDDKTIDRFRKGAAIAQISAGYDFALGGPFRAGVEIEAGRTLKSVNQQIATGVDVNLKSRWAVGASLRFGVMAGSNTLIFGRSGYSGERFKTTTSGVNVTGGPLVKTDTRHQVELFYGGGIEHKISDNLRLRVEYRNSGAIRRQSVLGGLVLKF
ncbi:hypothetical protein MNBD_ALPHA04-1050 [hydrothermal vent metagenome]|uniref:Outer membrane protein beta-barrel domain-containing protein n=1 Tax=hydrothermal vent metagenome TaxID=652676 RepID=A0A3B0RX73_9ZZZZ